MEIEKILGIIRFHRKEIRNGKLYKPSQSFIVNETREKSWIDALTWIEKLLEENLNEKNKLITY